MSDESGLGIDIGGRTVQVRGDLDAGNVAQLQAAFDSLGYAESINVDLESVGFMDSSGLRTILRAQSIASENGQELQIVAASRAVRRLFEISGVDDLLRAP
jgi:anti-sigma B factor antagonist